MRWEKGRRSKNVVDARSRRVKQGASLGGGAIIMALIAMFFFGQDPATVLQGTGNGGSQVPAPSQRNPSEEPVMDFLSVVLADTEDVWNQLFQQSGSRYREPQLVIFKDKTQSACGFASAASGPFYCPGDNQLYMDLSFLSQLQKMGASGDFALAYVIAHEVGHHVQNLTGRARAVQDAKRRSGKTEANQLQVRMELEADCYAGVWAHHGHRQRNILEKGDIEEGLGAAAAVGDDHLQKQSRGYVVPESFTHGTSKQRTTWFRRGLETGNVQSCNTFEGV
ncbi:MAG: neutral zinc metallopeptidase [Gammaproteobacteria bacterium]